MGRSGAAERPAPVKHDWRRIHGSFEIADPKDPPARATQAACAASGPAGGKTGEAAKRDPHSSLPGQQPARRQQAAQGLDSAARGKEETQ